MLEKFKTKRLQNPEMIFGGTDTSDDFIITDVIDGAITDATTDDFIIRDDIDGV